MFYLCLNFIFQKRSNYTQVRKKFTSVSHPKQTYPEHIHKQTDSIKEFQLIIRKKSDYFCLNVEIKADLATEASEAF